MPCLEVPGDHKSKEVRKFSRETSFYSTHYDNTPKQSSQSNYAYVNSEMVQNICSALSSRTAGELRKNGRKKIRFYLWMYNEDI